MNWRWRGWPRLRLSAQWGRENGRMGETETPDGGEPSDDWIELEALIAEADPTWWVFDMAPWDLLYPVIPF